MFDATDGGPAVAEMAGITGGSFVLNGVTWHHENDFEKLRRELSEWAQKVSYALGVRLGEFNLTPDQANRQIRELNASHIRQAEQIGELKSRSLFAADVIDQFYRDTDGESFTEALSWVAAHLTQGADRLEREQAAKTAQDHAIEQAARVICDFENSRFNHATGDIPSPSPMEYARVLASAGLLNTKHGEA